MADEKDQGFSAQSYTDVKNDFQKESELETNASSNQFGSMDTSVRKFLDSTNVKNTVADISKQDARAKQQYREIAPISPVQRRKRPLAKQKASNGSLFWVLILMTVLLVLTVLYKHLG